MLYSTYLKRLRNSFLILLASSLFSLSKADNDVSIEQKSYRMPGLTTLIIDADTQKNSGLQTAIAEVIESRNEFTAIGKIISPQPLLTLRERYLVAQADVEAAKSKRKQTQLELERQHELFRQGVRAKRSLQEQQTQDVQDKSLVDASHIRLMAIANEARLSWGNELTEWALSKHSTKLKEIISGKQHLLQVTLPTNKHLESNVVNIAVESNGHRQQARSAILIGRSAQVDAGVQGESYYFQLNADELPIGAKVTVWIPESRKGKMGVLVPDSAFIWHLDQIYAYIKISENTFARRLIKRFSIVPEGYLIEDGINQGEEVVTTGAQLLLSEELRGQIPDED